MSKSPSLRRIQADIRELSLDPSSSFHAAPLENDMFEWHFTIRGAKGTDFEGGIYHGRILLPPDYPFKPPHIIFLTPSGRFEVNTKVCLSFSAYHPELWQPAWGIRLILEALISFLPTPADGAIGALDWSSQERKRLATASQKWKCPHCGPISALIPPVKEGTTDGIDGPSKKSCSFAKEIAELHRLQQEAEGKNKRGNDKVDTVETDNQQETANAPDSLETVALEDEDDEEEIVFGDDSESNNDNDGDDGDDEQPEQVDEPADVKEGKVTLEGEIPLEPDSSRNTMDSMDTNSNEMTSMTERGVEDETITEVLENTDATRVHSTISWIYDPLLNILIVLLIVICYLLVQKWKDLSRELQALEDWEYKQQLEQNQLDNMVKDEAVIEL